MIHPVFVMQIRI